MSDLLTRVRSILTTTPDRWADLVSSIPEDLLAEKPAPDEWSAVECLLHMINTEVAFQARLSAFRAGQDLPGVNRSIDSSMLEQIAGGVESLVAEFTDLRQESLRLLESIDPGDFPLPARHPELGPVTLEQMLNQWAAHDLNHVVQAERALMQPFLRACGPWQKFFTDHLVQA